MASKHGRQSGGRTASAGERAKLTPELARELESQLRSQGLGQPQAQAAVQVFRRVAFTKSHRGPLPPAEDFEAYEAVFPGAAKEIIEMAVRQQEHSHFCERSEIQGELRYRMFGMASAVAIVLVLVVGAIACSIYGQTSVAIALGGAAGLTTLAGAFIKGRRLFEMDLETTERTTTPKRKPSTKRR